MQQSKYKYADVVSVVAPLSRVACHRRTLGITTWMLLSWTLNQGGGGDGVFSSKHYTASRPHYMQTRPLIVGETERAFQLS